MMQLSGELGRIAVKFLQEGKRPVSPSTVQLNEY